MRKILSCLFLFIIFNLTGCEDKKNEPEVKSLQKESIKISKYDDIYSKCMSSAQTVNNSTVDGCSGEAQETAEKDMNIVLEKIYIKLKDDEYKADALKEYQAAWVEYSNAEAIFDSVKIGPPQRGITQYTLTGQRIEFLDGFLKGIEVSK